MKNYENLTLHGELSTEVESEHGYIFASIRDGQEEHDVAEYLSEWRDGSFVSLRVTGFLGLPESSTILDGETVLKELKEERDRVSNLNEQLSAQIKLRTEIEQENGLLKQQLHMFRTMDGVEGIKPDVGLEADYEF